MDHSVVRHLRVEVEAYDASIRQFILESVPINVVKSTKTH